MSFKNIINQLPELNLFNDKELNLSMSYRYRKECKTIPILLLHGFNGNSKSWAYQFNFFKNKRSIIAIDAPGFGKSDPAAIDMLTIAALIKRLLKSININECDIVGHSMGGMLAQVISSRHNSLVRKVILSCTHKGYGIPEGNPLIAPFEKRLEERKNLSDQEFGILRVNEMLPELKNKEICNFLATISEEITEGSIKSGGMAMQILDTTKYLSELNQECLIITAVNDVVVSKERSIALENEIPHAETLMLSNVGHAPYCEDPLAFNNALEKFL